VNRCHGRPQTLKERVTPMRFLTSNWDTAGRDAGLHHCLVAAGLRARHLVCLKAHWYHLNAFRGNGVLN